MEQPDIIDDELREWRTAIGKIRIANSIKRFVQQHADELINYYKCWAINVGAPFLADGNHRYVPSRFRVLMVENNKKCHLLLHIIADEHYVFPKFEPMTIQPGSNFTIDMNNRQLFFGIAKQAANGTDTVAATVFADGTDNDWKLRSFTLYSGFLCDVCDQNVDVGGAVCEVCNFDTCSKCSKLSTHEHRTIIFKGLLNPVVIRISDILIELNYDIITRTFVD